VPENRMKHVGYLDFPVLCDQLTKLCVTQSSSLEECMKLTAVCYSSTGHVMSKARFEGFTANGYTNVSSKWRLAVYMSSGQRRSAVSVCSVLKLILRRPLAT
jgi:hypothetical protein